MQYSEVKELIAIFEKTDLNDMEVQLDNARIRLSRGSVSQMPGIPAMQQQAPVLPSAALTQPFPALASAGQEIKIPELAEMAAPKTAGAAAESTAEAGTKVIKAPIVGTFYQSSSPEESPFVKVGDTVSEGDVVCIIEAMKFMNEVNSDVSGVITEVLVDDGQFVEYGQELFRLK